MITLQHLGWNETWAAQFAPHQATGRFAGRISAEHRDLYDFHDSTGVGTAVLSGRLRHEAAGRDDLPAVGDWVALRRDAQGPAVIDAVLPRVNKVSRKVPGKAVEEQIIAANLDTLFLMTSLNHDLNPRRIERYLAAASAWQVEPVLILSKCDLSDHPDDAVATLRSLCHGLTIHAISAYTGEGLSALDSYLVPGRTVALIGSSGVGKSTLLNRLLGQSRQAVHDIRDHDRGRHTTTHREMIPLPQGALVIDNPGMRELQIWDEGVDVGDAFGDITALAARCRFADCRHDHEPHCAVKQAIADGELVPERLESLRKLQREVAFVEAQHDADAWRARKDEERRIHRIANKQWRRQRKD